MVSAQELGFKEGEATTWQHLSYLEAAPQIKAAGQHAAGTLFILEYRYGELERFADRHTGKWKRTDFERECPFSTNHFDTSTAALALENLAVIQHYSPQLAALTPETFLDDGGLKLAGALSGGNIWVYFDNDLKNLNRPLKEDEVVKGGYVHPIWLGFAEGQKELVRNVTPLVFKALRDCYNKSEGMGAYFRSDLALRSVVLDGLDRGAVADGDWRHLGDRRVRLVGLHSQEKEACAASASIDVRMGE